MHDLKLIRENPAGFNAEMDRRNPEMRRIDDTSLFATTLVQTQQTLDNLRASQNQNASDVGRAKAKGEDTSALIARGTELAELIITAETSAANLTEIVNREVSFYPNILAPDVPPGRDEADNVVLKEMLPKGMTELPVRAKEHFDVGEPLGLDFTGGSKLMGSRFTVLRGGMAKLARALGQFMLDYHTTDRGYTEVAPPVIVNRKALYGTGQFPKFEDDVFQVGKGAWLAPTSEVMLTNLYAGEMIDASAGAIRMAALTECFRLEAGSAGRDTRGIIRQHQFQKVELVSIVAPDDSEREHERMTMCAESILYALGLPYRRVLLCAGDTGFSARKTYDLEVWMAGAQRWREISSCSNCGDFQARRMGTRIRLDKKRKVYAHTLNGSGVAIGRALAAIIELYQNDDGTITIPEVLYPYMAVNSIGG